MSDLPDCKVAVLEALDAAGCSADTPVDLLRVGPALVGVGYTQDQIVNALDHLAYLKRLEYCGGNRVRLIGKPGA
jgi:hypothetical protein